MSKDNIHAYISQNTGSENHASQKQTIDTTDRLESTQRSRLVQAHQQQTQPLPFLMKSLQTRRPKYQCVLEKDEKFKKKLKNSQKALNKLICVVIICFFFMIVEVVGGYLSNSVAIMTDAAHMFSDVLGFGISIISIQHGLRAPNTTNTYGYHRSEVLGALASIIIIWVLVVGLIYEASLRVDKIINHGGYEMDPLIMMITAGIGLCCNIINLIALGDCSCKEDDEEKIEIMNSITSVFKPNPLYYSFYQPRSKNYIRLEQEAPASPSFVVEKGSIKDNRSLVAKGVQRQSTQASEPMSPTSLKKHDSENVGTDLIFSQKSDKLQPLNEWHSKAAQVDRNLEQNSSEEEKNINVRAAIVHMVGDLMQSVGVIAAGVVIYFFPDYKIVDPICTYVFSVIVFCTTINVFKDCYSILMEAAPKDVRTDHIREDILKIRGVDYIDDFHCWQLAGGKNVLTCHIYLERSADSEYGLPNSYEIHRVYVQAKQIIREHDICHTTIQVL